MAKLALFMLPAMLLVLAVEALAATPTGDAKRGAQVFQACVACHSLVPDRNMTGPSLAGIWGQRAATRETFERYSPALKASSVVWDAATLDPWLKSPDRFIPRNRMTFQGIANSTDRADVIAFLKEGDAQRTQTAESDQNEFPDLKKMPPETQVQSIRYCRDTYHVTTADGEIADFWETNLRLKTDSSDKGPLSGHLAASLSFCRAECKATAHQCSSRRRRRSAPSSSISANSPRGS